MSTEEALGFLRSVLAHLDTQPPLEEGERVAYVLEDAVVIPYLDGGELQMRVILGEPVHLPIRTGFVGGRGASFWAWAHGDRIEHEAEPMLGGAIGPRDPRDLAEAVITGALEVGRRVRGIRARIAEALAERDAAGLAEECLADLTEAVLGLGRLVHGLAAALREIQDPGKGPGDPKP